MTEHPEMMPELGENWGRLLKHIHSLKNEHGLFPNIKERAYGWIDYLEAHYIGKQDADYMRKTLSAIPDTGTIIHCDYNEGNCMIRNDGEMMLIDLDSLMEGHPIFDLSFVYIGHAILSKMAPDIVRQAAHIDSEKSMDSYRYMLRGYFDTDDEDRLSNYENAISEFANYIMLFHPAKHQGRFSEEVAMKIIGTHLPKYLNVREQLSDKLDLLFS